MLPEELMMMTSNDAINATDWLLSSCFAFEMAMLAYAKMDV